jgi:hypothetical protein
MKTRWHDVPQGEQVDAVEAFWLNQLFLTQDVANQRKALPGLAGRVYPGNKAAKKMVEMDGLLAVQLLDMTNAESVEQPPSVAQWTFDAVSLKALWREDRFGWGYSLFLPFKEYGPNIRKVQLHLVYVPKHGGQPIHNTSDVMALDVQASPPPRMQQSATLPPKR